MTIAFIFSLLFPTGALARRVPGGGGTPPTPPAPTTAAASMTVTASSVTMQPTGYIKLDWNSPSSTAQAGGTPLGSGNFTYTIFQDNVANTSATYNTISAGYLKDIGVLNIYPDIVRDNGYYTNGVAAAGYGGTTAANVGTYPVLNPSNLESWMETDGGGLGKIHVDTVAINAPIAGIDSFGWGSEGPSSIAGGFNADPWHYLTDTGTPGGKWLYDDLFFGSWDANGVPAKDLSPAAAAAVQAFLDSGHGVVFGHDTLRAALPNFATFAHYVDIVIPTSPAAPFVGNTVVQASNNGYLLKYPWVIPAVSPLTVPLCHSTGQVASATGNGVIWMQFSTPFTTYLGPAATNPGLAPGNPQTTNTAYTGMGTSNFYLTTNNNILYNADGTTTDTITAMIQTGHSSGASTPDEQHTIANVLFYLAQSTSGTSAYDFTATDNVAPIVPTAFVSGVGQITANDTDDGTIYNYQIKALDAGNATPGIGFTTSGVGPGNTYYSNDLETKCTSGVRAYYITQDNNPTPTAASIVPIDAGGTPIWAQAAYDNGEPAMLADTPNPNASANPPTAPADGVNVPLATPNNGGLYFHVVAVDYAGNISDVATISSNTPPPPPINLVNPGAANITGTGIPGDTVTITWPNGTTTTALVNPTGAWSALVPAGVTLATGNQIKAIQQNLSDPSGNSPPSSPTTAIVGSPPTQCAQPVIDAPSAGDTTVTGTGTPGDTVTVTFPDGSTGSATVGPDNTWSVPVPATVTLAANDTVSAVQTDPSGANSPSAPAIATVDGTLATNSGPPVINTPATGSVVIRGTLNATTGGPGSTVTVTLPNGVSVPATVNSDNTWMALSPTALPAGSVILATETDLNSSPSIPATAGTGPYVATPPTINPVRADALNVTGTGIPGDIVTLTLPSGGTLTATVNPNGTWSAPVPAGTSLAAGDPLSATQQDPHQTYPASGPTAAIVDGAQAQCPQPVINTPGIGATTVYGRGVPGDVVTVTFPNGSTVSALVAANGAWSVPVPATVTLTVNTVLPAVQTDPTGAASPSAPAFAQVGTQATNANANSGPPTIDPITAGATTISGRLNATTGVTGSTVMVTLPNGSQVPATVNSDRTWTATLPAPLAADSVVTATETDPHSSASVPATGIAGPSATAPPAINPVSPGAANVTGTGIPGDTITVTWPNGSTTTATVNPDGSWSALVPAGTTLTANDVLRATQQDPSGYHPPSGPASATVGQAPTQTPCDPPAITPPAAGDTTVSGTGTAGDMVTVSFPDGSAVSVPVDSHGNWSVPAPAPLTPYEVITAVQTDPSGTHSPSNPVIATVGVTTANTISAPPVITTPISGPASSVSGTGISGATVTVTWPDGSHSNPITVDSNGSWTATPPAPLPVGSQVVATQTVPGSAPSGQARATVLETSPPPSINTVMVSETTVSGTSTAPDGTVVTVTFPDHTTATATVSGGTWTATIPATTTPLQINDLVTATQTVTGMAPSAPVETTVAPLTRTISGVLTGLPSYAAFTVRYTFNGGTGQNAQVNPTTGEYSITGLQDDANLTVVLTPPNVAGYTVTPTSYTINGVTANVTGRNFAYSRTTGPGAPAAPTINPVTAGDRSVTVSDVDPNATAVTVTVNGNDYPATRNTDGTWTAIVPALLGGDAVSATQTVGGNTSPPASATVPNPAVPNTTAAPAINPVSPGAANVTGTGIPGDTVTVTWPNGSSSPTTVTVNPDGTWSAPVPAGTTLAATDIINATQQDPNNSYPPGGPTAATVGQTPAQTPCDQPNVNATAAGDTTVSGAGTPGDIVTVVFPDGSIASAPVDSYGNWTVPAPAPLTDHEVLTAVQTDPTGNHTPSNPTIVTVGATDARSVSGPPTIDPNTATAGSTVISGRLNANTGTNGSTVTVTLPDGSQIPATVNSDGAWTATLPAPLNQGSVVMATETDPNRAPSGPATATVLTPSASPSINPVSVGDTTVSGTSTAPNGTVVTVTFPDGSTTTATVNGGVWTAAIPAATAPLAAGQTVTATQTITGMAPSAPANATVSGAAPVTPASPAINTVTAGDTTVTVSAVDPNATAVTVSVNGVNYPAENNGDGIWIAIVPALNGGDRISAAQTVNGQTSAPATATVPALPSSPTINVVTAGDTKLTGACVPGATMTITFPDDSTVTADVYGDGTWAVNVPANITLTAGQTIKATQAEQGQAPITVSAPVQPAIVTYTVSGFVSGLNTNSGRNISYTVNGGSTAIARTDNSGYYSLTVPKGASVQLSPPVVSGYTTPPSITLTNVTANAPNNNFAYQQSGNTGGGGGGGGGGTSTYTVTYNANNGTKEAAVVDGKKNNGAAVTVPDSSFTAPDGKVFIGWSDSPGGQVVYKAGETFTMPGKNVTLYAVWAANKPLALDTENHFAYIIGYPDSTVHPAGDITRAEVATIFFRLLTDDSRKSLWQTSNDYSDVTAGKWFNNAVSTLSNAGVAKGYPNGTFRPDANITRAEFAAMASRFATEKPAGSASFSDINGHWAANEIVRAAQLGWITGYPDGTFRPNQNITRAEAMAIVNRVLNRHVNSVDDLLTDMHKWTDNSNVGAWYYYDVQEATNSHDYTRNNDGVNEHWTKMLSDPDWKALERPGYQP